METPSDEQPKRPRRRRVSNSYYGDHIDDLSEEDRKKVRWRMICDHRSSNRGIVEDAEERSMEDIRVRKDGSPSSRRPVATMPLAYWAVIEAAPDGLDFDMESRLGWYAQHLKMWAAKGLYKGGTRLKFVNREKEDADGGDP